jgi:1-acyl-sn-glycerol-3-phosphate acyltransferase
LWAVVTLALPLLLALTLSFDALARRRWATTRCLLFIIFYLTCEVVGIVASGAVWLAAAAVGRERYLHWNFRLECWWASTLFAGAKRIFSTRLAVEGGDGITRGPFILFSRHASIGDTLLPAILVCNPHGIVLRYVLKEELLWDPCLDIVGNRLLNHFVRRGSGNADHEIAALQLLMDDLGPNDGVLIYPEGTRFSEAKRQRILRRLAQSGNESEKRRAESLQHVLPPRLGGPLGLLERNRGADAVFCAHVGFEGAGSFRDLISGTLIDQLIQVSFRRIPFEKIPTDRDGRSEWLWKHWKHIDEWIGERQALQTAGNERAEGASTLRASSRLVARR